MLYDIIHGMNQRELAEMVSHEFDYSPTNASGRVFAGNSLIVAPIASLESTLLISRRLANALNNNGFLIVRDVPLI